MKIKEVEIKEEAKKVEKVNIIKERSSNFELLRIVLILMVITLHYLHSKMGGALNIKNITSGEFNYYLSRIIESACIIAVNCFVLITGYFMHDKKEIKIGKVLELFIIVFFYNITIYVLGICFNSIQFSKDTFIAFINTFTTGGPWFLYIYAILYLMIPFINIVINNCNKKQLKILISILLIFFSIWPTFISNITVKDNGYGIINFIILYIIGAYIHIYRKDSKNKKSTYILIYVLMTALTYLGCINSFEMSFAYNSIFNIISSISFFLIFKDIKFKSNIINKLANHTFGTYIIHVNTFLIPLFWKTILHTDLFYKSKFFILHLIGSVITTYLLCLTIDWIRTNIFKFVIDKKIKKTKLYNYTINI